MATNPFRQLGVIRNASKKGNLVTDCYRLMYNKKLWIKAYNKLNPNARLPVKDKMKNIIDRFSLKTIDEIIQDLKVGTFRFKPLRSVCISDKVGKKIVLGAPDIRDQLVHEVIKMILNDVYEPVFSGSSHGFREGKSCHTALSEIKNTWNGLTWGLEGSIQGFNDPINHKILIKLISKKINDRRFLLLIHNALKRGVLKNWYYEKSYSGNLQKGTISSLLVNIYLHTFDQFIGEKMKIANNEKAYRRMKYVRHADDFVIGIAGTKIDSGNIKVLIRNFLAQDLALELTEEKACITHLGTSLPFLGYEFRKWPKEKGNRILYKNNSRKMETIKLEIPAKKIKDLALKHNYGNLDDMNSTHRTKLINKTELEILMCYNAELRDIADYYVLANNYHHLDKLFYLATSSFIKTIAYKRRSTSRKVAKGMRKHKQGMLCLIQHDENGKKVHYPFLMLKDMPKELVAISEFQLRGKNIRNG